MSTRRICAHADESFVTEDGNAFVVIIVTEDERGYHETTYTGSLDYARKVAQSINDSLELSPDDVLDIRASSMRASVGHRPVDKCPECKGIPAPGYVTSCTCD